MVAKSDSFRNWGHRIVRNTLLKFIKSANRVASHASIDDQLVPPPDLSAHTPLHDALEAESGRLADTAYLLYLNLYLTQFQRLSAKEQRALTMVEIEGASYKAAADALGLRLENLKMVIFRGRRKILRGMAGLLGLVATPTTACLTSNSARSGR
jgi:DNA-directed RNA polymerase specialized sigma24 family protein